MNLGMDEADHQHQYVSVIEHRQREQQHALVGSNDEDKAKKKKAAHHCNTKAQCHMLCSKVLNAAVLYSEQIAEELDSDEMCTLTATKERG